MKPLFFSAMLALAWTAIAQVDTTRVVATVNGEPIKGEDYYRRMEFLPGVGKISGKNFFEASPGFLTLEQMITERLVYQLAKEKGAMPTDLEVADEYKNRIEDPAYLTNWKASGRKELDLKSQIRFELAQFKIATFGVTITDQELDKHYKDNPSEFTTPKQFKLRVIVVDSATEKSAVDSELAAGKSFSDVASAHSIDAGRAKGGEFGIVPITALQPQTATALSAVKIGSTSIWIESKGGDGSTNEIKFLVEDVIPEKVQELTPAVRRGLRRQLMNDRGAKKNDVQKEMREIRKKAKIDISQPEFADAYKKFIDAYLKDKG